MSVQSRLISFTALELVFSAGFLPANAMSSCITNDCAALGYTITDTSKCTGNIIRCPYDKSKAYCVSDTCGDKFYGITQCPANATCKNCEIGGITYQKTITCNENYVFDVNEWSCKSDLCPEGYARTAADCGSSGAQGWELSSYSSQTTPAGNKCYACNPKTATPADTTSPHAQAVATFATAATNLITPAAVLTIPKKCTKTNVCTSSSRTISGKAASPPPAAFTKSTAVHKSALLFRENRRINIRSAMPKSAAAKYISPAIPIITNISSFPQQKTPDFHPGFFITCKIRLESFSI